MATVRNDLAIFGETQFVSAEVIPNKRFDIQTSVLIEQFQQQVLIEIRFAIV